MHHEEPPEGTVMTEQLEIRIPFSDLTKVTIECPVCHAETSLDIGDKKHRGLTDTKITGFSARCA